HALGRDGARAAIPQERPAAVAPRSDAGPLRTARPHGEPRDGAARAGKWLDGRWRRGAGRPVVRAPRRAVGAGLSDAEGRTITFGYAGVRLACRDPRRA